MAIKQQLPSIHTKDHEVYLKEALARAGRSAEFSQLEVTELTGGRQSNKVLSLKTNMGAFALKVFPLPNWRDGVFGNGKGEIPLWLSGVTRALPEPIHCPTIDIAHNTKTNEEWMLMDDVSAGIMPRGIYDEKKLQALLKGLATLHAHYWESDELSKMPIISLETNIKYIAEPIAAIGGRIKANVWIQDTIKNITVIKPLVPIFLEVLGRDADFYLDLCSDWRDWANELAKFPKTLVHGDVRRANVSIFDDGRVSLFDWDMATQAPATLDLAWFWFLHFWCYPPNDGKDVSDREPLREFYIQELSEKLGERFDRRAFERAWEISWLKTFVQLGFCLSDSLAETHDADTLAQVKGRVKMAVDYAKRILS